jgi:MarR family transcriptional regulator, transcriptional regulator for hemolysin
LEKAMRYLYIHPTLDFLLNDVAHLFWKRLEQRAGSRRVTCSQWQAIAYLGKNEGIHQADLGELLDIGPITLVRILNRLAKRGLIERRQHPADRDAWQLFLKEAGRPLLLATQPLGEATRAEALSGVFDADRDQLLQTLTRMKTNLMAACRASATETEAYYG